jgi:hypothetical protein
MADYISTNKRELVLGLEGFSDNTPFPDTVLTLNGQARIKSDLKLIFGSTFIDKLSLFYQSSDDSSRIVESGGGNLVIQANDLVLKNTADNETYASFINNGAVSLYYDDSIKFATTSTGVTVTGTVVADGLDVGDDERIRLGDTQELQIYHNGTDNNSYIQESGSGNLVIQGSNITFENAGSTGSYATFTDGGAVQLFNNGSVKLATSSSGATTTGIHVADGFQAGDGEEVELGDAQDLKLYHDGTNSYIENATGDLYIRALTGEESIVTVPNAEVAAYYDNVRKVETTPDGIEVFGIVESDNVTEHKLLNDLQSQFDGVTTQFTLTTGSPPENFLNTEIPSEARVLISVGGIVQEPDPGQIKGFYISGGTDLVTDPIKINFIEAPKANQTFFGVAFGLSFEPPNAFVTKEQVISYSIVFGGI